MPDTGSRPSRTGPDTGDGPTSLVAQWPVHNAAIGWLANDAEPYRWGQTDRRFLLASVTKPLFAMAVLVAVEEGTLRFDQPMGPDGSTVSHLLSHSSGLAPEATSEPASGDGPGGRVFAPVGSRRIYSNQGFEILARGLAESSGMSADQYFHEAVVLPLGLKSTTLEGSPAHGAISTVDDMVVFLGELMNPTLISTSTLARASTPHLPDLAGVLPGFGRQDPNPWGLGFEIRGHKRPHWTADGNSPETFGHFGRSGTFIWIDPAARMSAVGLTDREYGPWAADAWPRFSQAVLDHPPGR